MTQIKDGGPAFPEAIAVGPAGDVYPGYSGMTLHQYYVGQALAGMCTAAGYQGLPWDIVASEAIKAADAVLSALAAREVKP
ncbi:hypothetical protein ACTJJ7_28005 [Phyllobacterium sp. 22229]|uniref:hypothetical protein n=1 Tax=Phyllobacterium sp. 22229 TaxID=3453895 RepID=UPI003F85B3C2